MHQYEVEMENECPMETREKKQPKGSLIKGIAKHVLQEYWASHSCFSSKSFKDIWRDVYSQLERETIKAKRTPERNLGSRIGPLEVNFNRRKYVGSFDFRDNDLEICSKDNFSTIYTNTCVYQGKWQYELLLNSKGVMQVGWATLNCEFSQENGVGDTPDSYAYDGNRQRKWNVTTQKYGETWSCGDVISCTINLDVGEISYFRNGRPMGVAFNNVVTGPGKAYFPAISLAIEESLVANFGETPFSYPQDGFQPLQAPPTDQLRLAKTCLLWLSRLVTVAAHWSEFGDLVELERELKENRKVALLVMAEHIGSILAPLLSVPYLIESALVTTLAEMSEPISHSTLQAPNSSTAPSLILPHTLFRFLMAILQEEEQKTVLNTLVMCLQRQYRQSSQTFDYTKQKQSLTLLYVILSEPKIRKFCLKRILFEKESHYRIMSFLCISCIDKVSFRNQKDINFWSNKNGSFACRNKEDFYKTVETVRIATEELEELQIKVLKLLFTSDDSASYSDSSRAVFLLKLRHFIKDQLLASRVTSGVAPFVSSSVLVSLFSQLFLLFVRLWEEEMDEGGGGEQGPGRHTLSPHIFYDGVLDYFDCQRLGGLESHLMKKFSIERERSLRIRKEKTQFLSPMDCRQDCSSAINSFDKNSPSTSDTVLRELSLNEMEIVNEGLRKVHVGGTEMVNTRRRSKEELRTSLMQLLDGVILIFYNGGHKQIEKVVAQTDVYLENVNYMEQLLRKMIKCAAEKETFSRSVVSEIKRSILVIQSKLKEQSYQHAWNLATTLSFKSGKKMQVLLNIILGVLQESSREAGLFTFVPDFYIESMTLLCHYLRHLILCDQETSRRSIEDDSIRLYLPGGWRLPETTVQDYLLLLMDVGEFLALHFNDSRIVYADSKDSLIQSLAGFVCHRPGLEALERMPEQSRKQMIKSLLQPYENRAWAQNNWILVRFWKGKGFAFRFTKSPHLSNKLGPKPAHYEIPNNLSSAPYFSDLFLTHVSETLQDPQVSSPFLNSLLNQLNWVFSEFIGMLQEIQNASNRPERVFIDSRQLRICATCFDLTLALLRVLEMIMSVAPNIFLDPLRQDSKLLLSRLCQLLCQVLNRVSVSSGCFSHVVNLEIPGLETIHYFPVLTSVIGIIYELLKADVYCQKDELDNCSATKALLNEESFQMSSLYPLVGGKAALRTPSSPSVAEDAPSISKSRFALGASRAEPTAENSSSVAHLFVTAECDCKYPKFCLRKYPEEIRDYEVQRAVDVINHLEEASAALNKQQSKTEDSETSCTICYARVADAVFEPCGHTSCTNCITHYLMNETECFFCKMLIVRVKEVAGNVIYESSSSRNTSL